VGSSLSPNNSVCVTCRPLSFSFWSFIVLTIIYWSSLRISLPRFIIINLNLLWFNSTTHDLFLRNPSSILKTFFHQVLLLRNQNTRDTYSYSTTTLTTVHETYLRTKLLVYETVLCVSALGCREVDFYCDRLGKHYSNLFLPNFWINYADSSTLAYMQEH
jgi:hypothetical protein